MASVEGGEPPVVSVLFFRSTWRSHVKSPLPCSPHVFSARLTLSVTTVSWMSGPASACGVAMLRRRIRKFWSSLPLLSPMGRHVLFEPQRASSITQPGWLTQLLSELSQFGAGS